ncbi:MAG: PhnA protein [Gammaproteobacteria bacterium]|nr:MAG: PhnA protein [Gammaproteobacteria bacterium]
MALETDLLERSDSRCELCGGADGLAAYAVPPEPAGSIDGSVLLCEVCIDQIDNASRRDGYHWRCLSDCMWSPVPAVQVMAWRMLKQLSAEAWAQDLLDTFYLDDATQAWAEATGLAEVDGGDEDVQHLDSNGAHLAAGDTVTLIKDLNVKGAGFIAKRGTAVRNISLVADNAKQVEGRVNGQQIVLLTEFVKKSG